MAKMKHFNTEYAKAMDVVERYFDVDITDADAAFDVLVDNGIDPEVAEAVANEIYPVAA